MSEWEHRDTVRNIQQIEEKDMALLVKYQVARIRPSTQNGTACTNLWKGIEPSRRYSHVYEIFISPVLGPEVAKEKDKVVVKFRYDECCNRASMVLKEEDFLKFYSALFPYKRIKGEKYEMVWGDAEPVKVKVRV